MASRRKQYYQLTLAQLEGRAHSNEDAMRALRRCEELVAEGKHPIIRYSPFHGYSVRDEDEMPTHRG